VADQIEKIDVHLSHTVYHHGWWLPERPLSPTGAQMNVAYVLAVAVLDGSALIEQFSPARINADDVWALIPRIEAHHDPSFDTTGPLGRGQTRLRITFTDGTALEASLAAARSALEPLPDAAVVEKFRRLTAGVVEPERSERILGLVLSLEELSDLEGLVEALAPVVRSPFDDGVRSGQLSSSDRGRWIRRW
jgi:2-methylcitrate dehydratase PrpD